MKVPVSNKDKGKSYYKYYQQDIYEGPKEIYAEIEKGGFKNSDAMTIHERNKLFDDGYLPGEFGYWVLDDGTATIANRIFLPGVNGEMFDWWFAWHPIDRLRYAIWDNLDHFDVRLEQAEKARDLSLSLRQRHWGSVHHIIENIGLGWDMLVAHFQDPADMGYDARKIDTRQCSTLVCANCFSYGNEHIPDIPVVMTHFVRPVDGGCELRTRFWFGWEIIDKEPVRKIPAGLSIPAEIPKALLCHNVREFSNLSKILPSVYAEEKDNW